MSSVILEASQSELALKYVKDKVLFPYQRQWISDRSRFKICNKARQIGISLCLGFEGLLDVFDGEPVYYVSRTERQSIYLLEKFYKWVDFFSTLGLELSFDSRSRTECRVNGVDVKSLTSEAAAGEGFSGNVYLDEFGLHENDEQIYRSLYPVITWGYKIRIVSRPFGQSNKFYEIWNDVERYPDYRRYEYDIHRAIADGLPVDVEELRRNFDEDGFAENYLCRFIDESTSYIPYDLIRNNLGEYTGSDGDNYLGIDIGRKHDSTILYIGCKLRDKVWTRQVREVKHSSFEDQKVQIREVIEQYRIKGGAMDSTGLGMQVAEELHEEFSFLTPVSFTNQIKEGMATRVKRMLEKSELVIPDDSTLITDIHSIRRTITKAQNPVFDANRTSTGHADRFWALALMLHSIEGGYEPRILFLD